MGRKVFVALPYPPPYSLMPAHPITPLTLFHFLGGGHANGGDPEGLILLWGKTIREKFDLDNLRVTTMQDWPSLDKVSTTSPAHYSSPFMSPSD